MDHDGARALAQVVSRLLGWTYTLAWSISFYPQPLLNWKRRSTRGFTADMAALNLVGFFCYATSTAAFLFSSTVLHQYALRHPQAPEPTVRANDFAFALHAVICCVVMYSQFWHRLWRFDGESIKASPATKGIISGATLGVAIVALVAWSQRDRDADPSAWAVIDVIYALSHVKLLITFIKYVPQAWHNYKVKSTTGWAIHTILLDLIGGVLSLIQLVIDSALQSDWSGISGNPVKFGLSIVSLFFDAIFIVQHYILYRDQEKSEDDAGDSQAERAPLLG